MFLRRLLTISVVLFVAAGSLCRAAVEKKCRVTFGAPMDTIVLELDEFYHNNYQPYKKMRDRLPCEVDLKVYRLCGDLLDALEKKEIDMAASRVLCYLGARKRLGAEPLLTGVVGGRRAGRGVLLVRKDSPYHEIGDLRGARFSAIASDSIIYRYFPWKYVYEKTGMKLKDFFSDVKMCPSISASLYSVIMGDSDAAMADEEFLKLGKFGAGLRPIAHTFEIPYPVFYHLPNPDGHVKAMHGAILRELKKIPDDQRIGKAFNTSSMFSEVEDPDYMDFQKVLEREGLLDKLPGGGGADNAKSTGSE